MGGTQETGPCVQAFGAVVDYMHIARYMRCRGSCFTVPDLRWLLAHEKTSGEQSISDSRIRGKLQAAIAKYD